MPKITIELDCDDMTCGNCHLLDANDECKLFNDFPNTNSDGAFERVGECMEANN